MNIHCHGEARAAPWPSSWITTPGTAGLVMTALSQNP
jgi:hypothetical protein